MKLMRYITKERRLGLSMENAGVFVLSLSGTSGTFRQHATCFKKDKQAQGPGPVRL